MLALSVIDLNLTLAHFNLVFTTDQGTFSVVWAPGAPIGQLVLCLGPLDVRIAEFSLWVLE